MAKWQPIKTAPKDGTAMVLHVDWEPLSVIGFWGSGYAEGSQSEKPRAALYDDGAETWRVQWDGTPFHWGYDEPTHWAPLPDELKKAGEPIKTAPFDGTKIDLWLEIPSSATSMGWADQFWVTDCWWQDRCWVHRHHGKDMALNRDYVKRWLPAGTEKPEGDDVHRAEP